MTFPDTVRQPCVVPWGSGAARPAATSRAALIPEYPFTPKSNRRLRPGQFWAVPLSDGRFAAGRVMAVPAFGPTDRTGLVVGLMDWSGDAPPADRDLVGRHVLAQAKTNYRAISRTGGAVLGERDLDLDELAPLDPDDLSVGSIQNVWGWATICTYAERAFVGPDSVPVCWKPDEPRL